MISCGKTQYRPEYNLKEFYIFKYVETISPTKYAFYDKYLYDFKKEYDLNFYSYSRFKYEFYIEFLTFKDANKFEQCCFDNLPEYKLDWYIRVYERRLSKTNKTKKTLLVCQLIMPDMIQDGIAYKSLNDIKQTVKKVKSAKNTIKQSKQTNDNTLKELLLNYKPNSAEKELYDKIMKELL